MFFGGPEKPSDIIWPEKDDPFYEDPASGSPVPSDWRGVPRGFDLIRGRFGGGGAGYRIGLDLERRELAVSFEWRF